MTDGARPDPAATMDAFRDFPNNTCPASRNVQMCAEALAADGRYGLLESDPLHVAGSLASVVASLWQARTFLANLGYTWTSDASGKVTWTKADDADTPAFGPTSPPMAADDREGAYPGPAAARDGTAEGIASAIPVDGAR